MTNEELAIKAKEGDQAALLQLWEQIRGLAWVMSSRWYNRLQAQDNPCGAEFDDFMQAAFLAMMGAVNYFDPQVGCLFSTTFVSHFIKTEFMNLLGIRSSKRDLLDRCISLDTPIEEGDEPETLACKIPDPENEYEKKDHEIWTQELHDAMEKVLGQLAPERQQALRLRYYEQLTCKRAAERMGLTRDTFRQVEQGALREIRKPAQRCQLDTFIDEITDFYRPGSGVLQTKPVEDNAIRREWQRERYAARFAESNA